MSADTKTLKIAKTDTETDISSEFSDDTDTETDNFPFTNYKVKIVANVQTWKCSRERERQRETDFQTSEGTQARSSFVRVSTEINKKKKHLINRRLDKKNRVSSSPKTRVFTSPDKLN